MLSDEWDEHCHDSNRMVNLFRSLSRIMLSLAKVPLPRIGSWTMDNRGVLTLTNRPLTWHLHQLENAQISTGIPKDLTYTSVEPYYLDLLACQDSRIRQQPNSIHGRGDGVMQLAAITGLRALLPKFVDRRSRGGPFFLSLTDLQRSNIFVDKDWHITRIIDLEWACVLPLQMLGPPFWLTNRGADQLYGPDLDKYKVLYDEFVHVLEEEESTCQYSNVYSQTLWDAWSTGRYWFTLALVCPDALCSLFVRNIEPKFGISCAESDEVLMRYWDEDAADLISTKVAQNERYNDQLRDLFSTTAKAGVFQAKTDSANCNKQDNRGTDAEELAETARRNVVSDVSAGENSQQLVVTTVGDLISSDRISAGAKSAQFLGSMTESELLASLSIARQAPLDQDKV